MTTKPTKHLLCLLIAGLFLLSGCQFILPQTDSNADDSANDTTASIVVMIDNAQSARAAVVQYIRDHYGQEIPPESSAWTEDKITTEGITSTAAVKFSASEWIAIIIFPKSAPEAAIYTTSVHNSKTGFRWEGQIDAGGTITEIVVQQPTLAITIGENEQPVGTPTPTATNTATNTATFVPSVLSFLDTTYRFSLQYPDNWYLNIASAGAANGQGGITTKFIRLQKGDFTIKIQYKFLWENTEFDESQPPGNVEARGAVTLLSNQITQNIIVDQGRDRLVFYGDSAEDIAYHIRIETAGDEIPTDIIEQAAWIVSTIQRTGGVIPSPVDTATPTLTPTVTLTASLTPIPNTSQNTTISQTDATSTPKVFPTATKVIPTPNIVNSVAPNGAFAYDFGANACLATWANKPMNESGDPNQVLPCLGTIGSSNGFITRIDNPVMEHRMDDEITLWVHPNEARYGYIQGTYPKYTVQPGDRFITTIGCMANYPKCSLDFQLYYKDAGGAVHSLGEWEENYNGQATVINLDLSSLAGQEVQFILRTVALTENTSSAQGFWFAPRIMH